MPTLAAPVLEDFARRLLVAGGIAKEPAEIVARSLVEANLRGHDSHGVMRIPSYLEQVARGEVLPAAQLATIRESDTTLVTDGGWGLGQVLAQGLVERLIVKAQRAGQAVGTLRRAAHVGRLGEYCERAADAGLVAMAMANTHAHARRVAPPGGKSPRLGTNPLAFGVPRGDAPLVLDFGTSATAEGKVRVRRNAGLDCPQGWLLDSEGRPTVDPRVLYQDPPGSILPLGGDQAYKGFGLALMVEILAGALSGGPCIGEQPSGHNGNCLLLWLVDPAALGGADHLAREVAALCEFVVSCPRIAGVDAILLPGDPERQTLLARQAAGVPIDDGNWRVLAELADRLSVQPPPG